MPSDPLYGLAAEFGSPEALLAAARTMHNFGYRDVRAYSPMPVDGLAELTGLKRTMTPFFFLTGAVLGVSGGFGMQWFANVVHLPWNIGGRPMNSWPAFVPITFEMGILFAAVTGVTAMVVANRLPRPFHPMFHAAAFDRASRDRFFLCVKSTDHQFRLETTRRHLEDTSPLSIAEVPW
jgi:hypothetical protein